MLILLFLKKEKHIQHHGANIYKKILFNHGGEKYTGKKNIKELLRENVKCEVNLHNGIITLQTSAQEPFIAYQLLDSVEQRLQQHLTKYSFDKAKNWCW